MSPIHLFIADFGPTRGLLILERWTYDYDVDERCVVHHAEIFKNIFGADCIASCDK